MNVQRNTRGEIPVLACLALAGVLLAGCASQPPSRPQACAVAQQYIDAGNTGDARLAAPLMADNVSAVFLEEGGKAHAIRGKEEVLEAVQNYTSQCSSCRSTLRCLHSTSNAVYVIEDVVFVDQDGVERRQSAPLVIELDDRLIRTIIYYPADSGAYE